MDDKQVVYNEMSLPINEDFKAVSVAVGRLLSEGWVWAGIHKPEQTPHHYISLTRRFEYDPNERIGFEVKAS